jgi:hypothetical protein
VELVVGSPFVVGRFAVNNQLALVLAYGLGMLVVVDQAILQSSTANFLDYFLVDYMFSCIHEIIFSWVHINFFFFSHCGFLRVT